MIETPDTFASTVRKLRIPVNGSGTVDAYLITTRDAEGRPFRVSLHGMHIGSDLRKFAEAIAEAVTEQLESRVAQ